MSNTFTLQQRLIRGNLRLIMCQNNRFNCNCGLKPAEFQAVVDCGWLRAHISAWPDKWHYKACCPMRLKTNAVHLNKSYKFPATCVFHFSYHPTPSSAEIKHRLCPPNSSVLYKHGFTTWMTARKCSSLINPQCWVTLHAAAHVG